MRPLMIAAVLVAMVTAGCGGDDKTTAPTTGSCCAPDGSCTVTDASQCVGGSWTVGLTCVPNACTKPTGACCHPDGTCAVTLQSACNAAWSMFGVCDPNTCQEPSGACCHPDGSCTVTLAAACTGLWTMFGTCSTYNCTQPTGACCHPDGSCAVIVAAGCIGIWTMFGPCDPNPCTQSLSIWIPAGNVRLGQIDIAEPVNDFYVEGFYIDRYEVSNATYKAFIDAGGYTTEAYWNPVGWAWRAANNITLPQFWTDRAHNGGRIAGNEAYPVVGVSWWEADAYCRWAGKRLPTEAEWEKAAKGGCETHGDPGQCDASDTPTYPWGEGIAGPQANYYASGDLSERNGWTTPVGYYNGSIQHGYQTIDSPSPYGLYDVAGNVWEWCSTAWAEHYPYDANDGRENPPAAYDECCRVLRGGSCYDWGSYLGCAVRTYGNPGNRYGNIGFRCARTG